VNDDVLADLLQRAVRGDSAALGRLLDGHRDYLRGLAERLLDSRLDARLDASDLVQQTCLSVHKKIAEFDGHEPAQFVAWLRQVHERNIQNAVRDQQADKRAAEREVRLGDVDPRDPLQATPSQRVIRGEESDRLARALDQLPRDEREALRLRYLEGRTLAQVADEMGLTRDALVWLMKRGMKRLKANLDEH
jgi:RNA polymerase sigma-70 factor (ECF subfamily)